jgi:hypothetical protein
VHETGGASSQQRKELPQNTPQGAFVPVSSPPFECLFQCIRDPVGRRMSRWPSDSVTPRLHQTALWRVRLAAGRPEAPEIRPRLHQTALRFTPRRRFQVPSTPQSSSGRRLNDSSSFRFETLTRIGACHSRCHSACPVVRENSRSWLGVYGVRTRPPARYRSRRRVRDRGRAESRSEESYTTKVVLPRGYP